jgi:hypothetical protein
MHTCVWRSTNVWRPETNPSGWVVLSECRLQQCSGCKAERNLVILNRRRRCRPALSQQVKDLEPWAAQLRSRMWVPISKALVLAGVTRVLLDEHVADMVDTGWLEVEEAAEIGSRDWTAERLRLTESAYQVQVVAPREKRIAQIDRDMAALQIKMAGWEVDSKAAISVAPPGSLLAPVVHRLTETVSAQAEAIGQGIWAPLPGLNLRLGGPPHRLWIATLRGLLAVIARGTWEYERTFAARWLGDSKALSGMRQKILKYLGVSLFDLGLFRHTPIVRFWGDLRADVLGYPFDGRAGIPFVSLGAETVTSLAHIKINARAILVVENQTAFETVLRPPLRHDDVLYLFSHGHAGIAERAFLHRCLQTRPDLAWHIWTDWDLGGVRIILDWSKWADHIGVQDPLIWPWHSATPDRWRTFGTALSRKKRLALEALDTPMSRLLCASGYTLEQEAVLPDLAAEHFSAL